MALMRLGGVARATDLQRATSRRKVTSALAAGEIVRAGAGYALAHVDADLQKARALNGVLPHASAASQLGWPLKQLPAKPQIIVPSSRRVAAERRRHVEVRYRDLDPDEVRGMYTAPLVTLVDCAKVLPFDEALAVADSALRMGTVTAAQLRVALTGVATTGRAQCLRVAAHADGRAANPFESVLRAIALDVPGLNVEPQVRIELDFVAHPDLVDRDLRIVLEADSWEFHGGRKQFDRDCARYNMLSLAGYTVLRFSYEAVMYRPGEVRAALEAAVAYRNAGNSPGAGSKTA